MDSIIITLRAARINAGLSASEVAEKIGVSSKTVCNWELGKTKPRFNQVKALCSIYQVPENCVKVP